jgi:hypothetical protein
MIVRPVYGMASEAEGEVYARLWIGALKGQRWGASTGWWALAHATTAL